MKYYSCLILTLFILISCAPEPTKEAPIKQAPAKKSAPMKKRKTTVNHSNESIIIKETDTKYSSAKANAKINPQNIDLNLLEILLHEEINKARKANKLSALGKNTILRNAAVDQNNYQLTVKDLTHKQKTPGKENLIDRVRHYGGGFQLIAENLIYEGFTVRTTNGVQSAIITPTYREMAKTMTRNWLNSPPHRKNILQRELKLVGTAMAFNGQNNAVYATQVFGTKM